MTERPTDQNTDIPSYEVLVNGEALSQETQILSISVHFDINKVPKAYVSISDGDVAANDFPISSSDTVIPGNEIEIKAGYHSENESVFKGIITTQRVRIKKENASITYIEAQSSLIHMTLKKKYKIFEESTDSDIASELCGNYSFDADIEDTSVTHETMVQYNTSDWDFMLSQAEVNNQLIYPTLEGLKIAVPSLSESPSVTLEYGNAVLEFDLEINAKQAQTTFKTLSWNPADQALVEAEELGPWRPRMGQFAAW